jgi:hypothetical protein
MPIVGCQVQSVQIIHVASIVPRQSLHKVRAPLPNCCQQERVSWWPRGERVLYCSRPNEQETAGCIDPRTSLLSQCCIEGMRVRSEVQQQGGIDKRIKFFGKLFGVDLMVRGNVHVHEVANAITSLHKP